MKKIIACLLLIVGCWLSSFGRSPAGRLVTPASAQGIEDERVLDPETGQVMYYLSEEVLQRRIEELPEEVDLEALEEEEGFLPSPTSPFYFLQSVREKVEEMLAGTPEKKADVAMRQARRRLLEMRKLSLEEEGEQIESQFGKLQQRYEEKMDKAEEKAGQAGEKMDEVKEKILEKREAQVQVLQGVLEKAPEQAQSALQKVIERHEQNTERFMNRWEERVGRIEDRLQRHREGVESRFERKMERLESSPSSSVSTGATEGRAEEVKPVVEPRKIERFERKSLRDVQPLKPSVAQPRPLPSTEKGKKVLGVFDEKSFWQGIWEVIKGWGL